MSSLNQTTSARPESTSDRSFRGVGSRCQPSGRLKMVYRARDSLFGGLLGSSWMV